jgi:transcriptional regulator with GAF, ATPase, and Fis domain
VATEQRQIEQREIGQFDDGIVILAKVVTAISEETDKQKILASVLPHALTISQSEMGVFLVVGDESERLNAVVRQEMPDELVNQLTQGNWGKVLLEGKQLWLKPQPRSPNAEQSLLEQYQLNHLFGLPLRVEGRILGAIVVGSRITSEQSFGQKQQRWLAMLAQLVALFLDNVRLRTNNVPPPDQGQVQKKKSPTVATQSNPNHSIVEELEHLLAAAMSSEEEVVSQNNDFGLLNRLSDEMGSTFQLNDILKAAVRWTQSILEVKACWCYLFENGVLTLREYENLSEQYVAGMQHLSPGDGVEGMAFSRNEPVLRDGVLFHSGKARRLVQEEGLHTVAAVPLKTDRATLGVLAVANQPNWVWSARDQRMLASIGQQVARAVVNSQQFTKVQEKAQGWESSYSALQQANSHLTQRTEVLERKIQELHQVEQQIWTALAASQKSRHPLPDLYTDQQLIATLQRILATISTGEYQP